VTDRIAAMIDAGHPGDALTVIQEREAARAQAETIGEDVQLQYQKARAMAALGRHDEAMALWRSMTENYPELPEPWNALAIEYASQGRLSMARDALNMALASDPTFAPALENLGHVQMALAQQSFARAKALQAQPAPQPPVGPDTVSPVPPPVPGSGTGTVSPAAPAPAAR
jgi:tetratricopeptide (TPR) repeat protein